MHSEHDARDEDLIDAIYRGMASKDHLEEALNRVIASLGANGGNFHIVSKADLKSVLFLGSGPNYTEANISNYLEHWRHVNVHRKLMRTHVMRASRRAFLCHEHLTDEHIRTSPYLNEFYFPMGERWLAGAVAFDGVDYEVAVAFNRAADQTPFQEAERRLIESLLPHVRRAASLSLSLAGEGGFAQGLTRTLEGSTRAAFLVDGTKRVLWRNQASEAFLEREEGLSLKDGRLSVLGSLHTDDFTHAVECALNRDPATTETLAVVGPSGAVRLEILPATLPVGGVFGAISAALVLVRQNDLHVSTGEILRRQFGLTKAEIRFAMDLAEGLSIDEAADRRQLQRNTLRAHLRTIFQKTGVTRQASLVALIWRLSP